MLSFGDRKPYPAGMFRPTLQRGLQGFLMIALLLIGGFATSRAADAEGRIVQPLEDAWRFAQADFTDAKLPEFDDQNWRCVNVPHDWSIEGAIDQNNPGGKHAGFLPTGIGWYRKHFVVPETWKSRKVWIEFDGVMANSQVWINGHLLGQRPSGYVSFRYDLTEHLVFGESQTNTLAVRTDTSVQPASRWYSGSGIYRHVRLVAANHLHLDPWGIFVATPEVSTNKALVRASITVINQSAEAKEAQLRATVLDTKGNSVASAETKAASLPGTTSTFTLDLPVENPQLWDVTRPYMYQLHSAICSDGKTLDNQTVRFGIRDVRWEPATGFWLNGRNLKIKGLCIHHDCGALGAAVPSRAWERRFEILKQIGCNAIRTSHNAPSPEFLDLADSMGFLVMHEIFDTWTLPKRDFDESRFFNQWWERDLTDTLLRDRNHPSIVIYSAGNEIPDLLTTNRDNIGTFKRLLAVYHKIDPTRPVTLAAADPAISGIFTNGLAELEDIVGQNYSDQALVAQRQIHPSWKILSTEDFRPRKSWVFVRDQPSLAGQFVWCAFDYLGESYGWPEISFDYGIFDRTGHPTAWGREREAYWSEKPTVQLMRQEKDLSSLHNTIVSAGRFADWTPHYPGYNTAKIVIFGNCQEVEVTLNGKSLGIQPFPKDASPVHMEFPFEPGTITALGKNNGKVVCSQSMTTAGKPARLALCSDRTTIANDWDDIATVLVTVVDDKGIQIPTASDLISFSVSGPGKLIGTDSGDLTTQESFQAPSRRAYNGQCLALVKTTSESGEITLTASAPGLSQSVIVLKATSPLPNRTSSDGGRR